MRNLILTVLLLGVICFTSIFPSCSTANLSNVKLCNSMNSGECGGDMTVFQSDIPSVYCSAVLKNAPSDTKVTFEWKHGGESMGKAEVKSGDGIVNSYFRPNAELPPGKYSVTLKIDADNTEPITKEFTVE